MVFLGLLFPSHDQSNHHGTNHYNGDASAPITGESCYYDSIHYQSNFYASNHYNGDGQAVDPEIPQAGPVVIGRAAGGPGDYTRDPIILTDDILHPDLEEEWLLVAAAFLELQK